MYYALLAISGGHCTSRTQALLFLMHVIAKHRDNQQDCEFFGCSRLGSSEVG
jgi:hypothetical protein